MATNVVVVGGGNAAHVLSARISSCCPDFRCVLLTRFDTEAEDLHAACAEHGGGLGGYWRPLWSRCGGVVYVLGVLRWRCIACPTADPKQTLLRPTTGLG